MQNNDILRSIEIVQTGDGSLSIFNPQIGENYHSINGALQESKHVFVQNGLQHYHQHTLQKEISILEVGFGTGLNFLLSAEYANQQQLKLKYRGIEAFPLQAETLLATKYEKHLEAQELHHLFIANYEQSFEEECSILGTVSLRNYAQMLLDFNTEEKFDIIYFDAFAKQRQAEMWTDDSIKHACRFLKDKGIFVSYSVTGDLKRQLKSLGFEIERPQGATGKREMMRATLAYVL